MDANEVNHVIIRQLTESDLVLFAAPRDTGKTKSKQSVININSRVVDKIIPPRFRRSGQLRLRAVCTNVGIEDSQLIILSKVHKNWSLGGNKIPGKLFAQLEPGDLLIVEIDFSGEPPFRAYWKVIMKNLEPELHRQLLAETEDSLEDRMLVLPSGNLLRSKCQQLLHGGQRDERVIAASTVGVMDNVQAHAYPVSFSASSASTRTRRSIRDKIRQPHILEEMMRMSTTLSARAQAEYLDVLEKITGEIHEQITKGQLVSNVDIQPAHFWKSVKGKPVAFVDGGMASLSALGAAPIAIRVGIYLVIPGGDPKTRERLSFSRQLVDELFADDPDGAIFEDIFPDLSRLKDVARIVLETAGALDAGNSVPRPDYVFLHGPLINPVSEYALPGFPNFSFHGLQLLLPEFDRNRSGAEANFVAVYRRQLELLEHSQAVTCGVVERSSASSIVGRTLLELLRDRDQIDSVTARKLAKALLDYRITDGVLFQCLLDEGEYLQPILIDRNVAHKAPEEWKYEIARYPRPLVTYVIPGDTARPVRVELFKDAEPIASNILSYVVHSCRLMPHYSFPAGLDIVDKHTKIPAWMSRPVNSRLEFQLLRRAMDTRDPRVINSVRKLLTGTVRDWLYRTAFDRISQ